MKAIVSFISRNKIRLGLVALATLPALAGLSQFWTESEMWNTVVAKHLFDSLDSYDFTVKPLFELFLYLNFQFAKTLDLHPMIPARVIFVLNGFAMAGFVYMLAKKYNQSGAAACVTVLMVFANSFIIKRYFNVRSDVLISTLFLALTYWYVTVQQSVSRREKGYVFTAVSVAAFLLTPKSALIAGAWAAAFFNPKLNRWFWTAAGLAFLGWFFFSSALDFFLESFTVRNSNMDYFDPGRLEHLIRLVVQNPLLIFIWILCLRFHSANPMTKFANYLFCIMLLYPERLPFYLASLLPFFYLGLAAAWPVLTRKTWAKPLETRRMGTALAVFAGVSIVYWSLYSILNHNNSPQRLYVNWIEKHVDQLRGLKVFDPAGTLPFADVDHWFIGPAEAGNRFIVPKIRAQKTDVILGAAKMLLLGAEMEDLLKESYWTSGDRIYIRKIDLEIPAYRLGAVGLIDKIRDTLPMLLTDPHHKIHFMVLAPNGLNMNRYAKWVDPQGKETPLNPDVGIADIPEDSDLVLPPFTRLYILPTYLVTPYDLDWWEVFRFDPES